jgi:hypothetical protein
LFFDTVFDVPSIQMPDSSLLLMELLVTLLLSAPAAGKCHRTPWCG